ncbi:MULTISPECIES: creatininase family protein [unclassified Spirosoma]|uniref:creatininase family protein n=1 Tax=unclassified Spirosoma TaxID=2621999 RepID=UPI000968DC6B|nr:MULTISPECIES: creatininase family protein [unclassified Spirosoma]MBN8826640.1 creatininase family protein [Spirosoma sp.]OJW74477.1 MAG: creatininase [Spirosoma sp. 48-14]
MKFSDLSYPQINRYINKVLLLPLGAIEQHGPHLAVSTDTDIVTRVAQEAEKALPDTVLLCPTLPFGSSHHHLSFGGTMSLAPELYTQVIIDLVQSLVLSGHQRIVLLNGHGGNITPVKQALAVLSKRFDASHQPTIALATYWELAGSVFAGETPMESPALSHACEYETSLMLHLFPEKVWMDQVVRAQRPERNGYIGWEDDEPYRGVTVFKQTEFISSNGSSGEPQLGTPKKGNHLFDAAVRALIQFLDAFKNWPLSENLATKP